MFDCNNLLHPFQTDPGTSQRQRIVDHLVNNAVKIDARSLADLLNYFSKLSTGINFHDKELNVSNWQPFFSKSLPFLLASLSSYDDSITRNKFELYKKLFDQHTSIHGLQLMFSFILYNTFSKINTWYEEVKGTNLPIENAIEELVRSRLATHLKIFIAFANTASKWFCIKKFDFTRFLDTADSDIWNLELHDLYAIDNRFTRKAVGRCELLKVLYKDVSELLPILLEGMKQVVTSAEESIKDSLVPQAKELQENHPPHLALVFAFINLFQKLQGELNKKTKEHLHFFYSEVLKIKPAQSRTDRAHVIFELQKLLEDQYEKYKVDKGAQLLAGRDAKNFDILFGTDEEIIVNEAQITDLRTLFLNYKEVNDDNDYLEGVYIAPNAVKADGVEKDFGDNDPRNWFTLGRDNSKYIEPGKKTPKKHPQSRLGFILASQVLYLAEGERTIDVNIACRLSDSLCNDNSVSSIDNFGSLKNFLFDPVSKRAKSYLIINNDFLNEAAAQGMTMASINKIRDKYLELLKPNPCTFLPQYKEEVQVELNDWNIFLALLPNADLQAEVQKLPELFKTKYPIKVYFSGEEEWIVPEFLSLELTQPVNNQFMFKMQFKIAAGRPAVTFYNKENLKEDFGTTLPLVKIELDDSLKIAADYSKINGNQCCLKKQPNKPPHITSSYHYFRNINVIKQIDNLNKTGIKVQVCELKNFVVQNDENLMDVNAPIYPFGTRPDVPGFDLINKVVNPNLNGPNFYIGSKEVFCKKWDSFQINLKWKEKPANFNDYYKGYIKRGNVFGLNETDFEYKVFYLQNGVWKEEKDNRKLFPAAIPVNDRICGENKFYEYAERITFSPAMVPNVALNSFFDVTTDPLQRLDVDSRNGFIRLQLRNQDFGHKDYAFILARQMLAYSKLPDDTIATAVYYDQNGDPIVIDFTVLYLNINTAHSLSLDALSDSTRLNQLILADPINPLDPWNWTPTNAQKLEIRHIARGPNPPKFPQMLTYKGLQKISTDLHANLHFVLDQIDSSKWKKFAAVIPNEPWTPIISNISIDYIANAFIEDIDLIHLYPFANTYKSEEIELEPTLFPTFCEEGNLYIGLSAFQPGSNLHVLFQFAEATADSEAGKENVRWHYLDNNIWKELRIGFEVLEDNTLDLTTSGIIRFALPENMSTQHTIMPRNLHWIKASLNKNSRTVSETIGIHTQAITATFVMGETTDTARLGEPLAAGKIEKLLVATPNIKALTQPYESFGGRLPELEGAYYVRVSEQLRHKGRAIQKWDYERLTLEEFPQIFKVKCINHSFQTDANSFLNDVPYAPGYVILAVIPDLRKLKAGNSFEPKVPVSILNQIDNYLKKKTSPFVRLRTSNPRYEKVHFCITVRFKLGVDENYYTEKLKSDISEYLAPWSVGKYDKLTFGQCIYRSDIIRFIERTGYVDFILDLKMKHSDDTNSLFLRQNICPKSPRSILVAGNIDIIKDPQRCDSWCDLEPEEVQCDQYQLVNDYCIPEPIPVEPTPPPPDPIN